MTWRIDFFDPQIEIRVLILQGLMSATDEHVLVPYVILICG